MIRELPRGPFGAYLHRHYLSEKTGALPKFSMGCGAIFMIHRVHRLDADPVSQGVIPETDPQLLREMINLVSAKGLEVISLSEMRAALESRPHNGRFVCFTFDGAYKTICDVVLPMFAERGMPFAVYAATDYLGTGNLPWWLSLEALVESCERLSLTFGEEQTDLRCRTADEKQAVFARLFRRLSRLDDDIRQLMLDGILKNTASTRLPSPSGRCCRRTNCAASPKTASSRSARCLAVGALSANSAMTSRGKRSNDRCTSSKRSPGRCRAIWPFPARRRCRFRPAMRRSLAISG
ncbi:MAG: hypothetical protein HC850_08345 [Rhodomicrobium sp.]|nr:hypothetical protein [Rhodomicrobium sp.]